MVASTDHGLTIGRASDNDLVVAHPSVSAHHAELHFDGEQFLLRDLSSSNGTFVNGERITAGTLQDGDTVHVGPVALEFANGQLQIRVDLDKEPEETKKPKNKTKPVLVSALVIGVGVAVGLLLFFGDSDKQEPPTASLTVSTTTVLATTAVPVTTVPPATTAAPTSTIRVATTVPTTTAVPATTAAPTSTIRVATTVPTTTAAPTTTTKTPAEIADIAIFTATYKWAYSEQTKSLQDRLGIPADGWYGHGTRTAHLAALNGRGLSTAGVPTPPTTTTQTPATTAAPTTTAAAPTTTTASTTTPQINLYQAPPDLGEKIDTALDATVGINCISGGWIHRGSGWPLDAPSGSATIIVTNHHVIKECVGPDKGTVDIDVRGQYGTGQIINYDAEYDLAIIETSLALTPLPTAGWPQIGHWVMAVGNPVGFVGSVNTGRVSNLTSFEIVHDVSTNSGNSGGPLINAAGQVVGVHYAGYADDFVEGVNFAIALRMLCDKLLVCDNEQWQ